MLHFVDICENKVFHLDTRTLALSVETFDEPITCLALRDSGEGLACTTGSGFAVLDGGSKLHYLCKPLPERHIPYVRFNDGACDSKGRFFAGSLYSKEQDIPGQLWMYDPSTSECKVVDEGPFTAYIPGCAGLKWTGLESRRENHASMKSFSRWLHFSEGSSRYFTDSLNNLIYAYDYDDGKLSNRRVAIDAIAEGLPEKTFCDGLCIDKEGYIWCARFIDWLILEYIE
ncbi:hypothetical protein JVU11DRAFT_5232 [Chiua virens]|nr:hypothetical protein JVU11DRAFT_5232 [Chiua virens]